MRRQKYSATTRSQGGQGLQLQVSVEIWESMAETVHSRRDGQNRETRVVMDTDVSDDVFEVSSVPTPL